MKKKPVTIIIAIILLTAIGIRLYIVNHNVDKVDILKYGKGEVVSIGKNFFEKSDEVMDGYTIKVLDSWIVPVKDYLIENNESEELIDTSIMQYFYIVRAEFVNEYNNLGEEQGIDLKRYVLRGTDYILTPDWIGVKMANETIETMGFSLLPNKPPFEVIIPFGIYETVVNVEHIKEDPPMLQVSSYPELKLIKVN